MTNEKILQMLNNGEIELLKATIAEEIYKDSLKPIGNKANKRYTAMKKYFSYYYIENKKSTQKPCKVEYKGAEYTSFMNGISLALTTESTGNIEMYEHPDEYFKVEKVLKNYEPTMKINLVSVIAEAKSKGYKLLKKEFKEPRYFVKIQNHYFKTALIDITMSIIDDGDEIGVYVDEKGCLCFYNKIGIGMICPMNKIDTSKITVVDLDKED